MGTLTDKDTNVSYNKIVDFYTNGIDWSLYTDGFAILQDIASRPLLKLDPNFDKVNGSFDLPYKEKLKYTFNNKPNETYIVNTINFTPNYILINLNRKSDNERALLYACKSGGGLGNWAGDMMQNNNVYLKEGGWARQDGYATTQINVTGITGSFAECNVFRKLYNKEKIGRGWGWNSLRGDYFNMKTNLGLPVGSNASAGYVDTTPLINSPIIIEINGTQNHDGTYRVKISSGVGYVIGNVDGNEYINVLLEKWDGSAWTSTQTRLVGGSGDFTNTGTVYQKINASTSKMLVLNYRATNDNDSEEELVGGTYYITRPLWNTELILV